LTNFAQATLCAILKASATRKILRHRLIAKGDKIDKSFFASTKIVKEPIVTTCPFSGAHAANDL
jgi:hypothetical protein